MADLAVYSVPHTGTRFVASFLRHMKIPYSQRHVSGDMCRPEGKRVLPVRDPFKCYLSHQHKNEPQSDARFVGLWGEYIFRTYNQDCFYFALDVPEDNRLIMLQKLVEFGGVDITPAVMDRIREFEWAPVGRSNRNRAAECPDEMQEILRFARQWYEHFTVFWGAYYRNPNNLLGDGR